jgi:hypothetical protein
VSTGATIPYHQRQNKHVERQIFIDILRRVDRWRPMEKYLYVGFGGVYFEDFKLLHRHFGIDQMISIEQEEWLIPRQKVNLPYGCIIPRRQLSGEFIQNVEEVRQGYPLADHLLTWLDYAKSSELPNQLTEVRALLPKLEADDVLKITLSANPKWLRGGSRTELENRLENLKNKVGAQYLAEGLTEEDVENERLPEVLLGALKRMISEGMTESPRLYFQPLGCYVYRDSVTMLTATGILLHRGDRKKFFATFDFDGFALSSRDWKLHRIKVPALSLPEKLMLDQLLFEKSPSEVSRALSFRFAEDLDESLELIENYQKLYRYYPNYHRVQF